VPVIETFVGQPPPLNPLTPFRFVLPYDRYKQIRIVWTVRRQMAELDVLCMGCTGPDCNFKPMRLKRRAPGPEDLEVEMKYCGICHTDVHSAKGDLQGLTGKCIPCVPGHELSGICTFVGDKVTGFAVGDQIGVGCMVDSCGTCAACKRGEEQMCAKQVATYNGKDAPGSGRAAIFPKGSHTLGGYTNKMVVHYKFAIKIPSQYPLELAGPVMCAGVTLYDPLVRYEAAGKTVAIVGLGGLGCIGIKIAVAMGCKVTAVSSSLTKESVAKSCGAVDFVVSSDKEGMLKHKGRYDIILNTRPDEHDYTQYTPLLTKQGKHIILGLNSALIAAMVAPALVCGSRLRGSGIGSIKATQDVINLCAEQNIRPDIQVITVNEINSAFEALDSNKNSSAVRHVIDLTTLNDAVVDSWQDKPAPTLTKPDGGLTLGRICSAICGMLCCCRAC